MSRRRFVYDKATGNVVEIFSDQQMPVSKAPMIIGDIEPYRSIITGEEIGGRRQHREHLRQHGCEELGNDHLPKRQMKPLPPVREDMQKAVEMVKQGYRPPKPQTHREGWEQE
jgi:hypothetical protein